MHSFTFNGTSSTSFNIKIEQYRNLNRPARKYNVYDIYGRNGNAYSLTDTFEEVEQSYQIFATDSSQSSVELFGDIMEWLHSADGYAELTDTYDTTHYRMAVFVDSADISNSWNKYGRMVVTFRCRPERYIVTNTVISGSPMTNSNSTYHDAKPLISFTGSGKESLFKPADERPAVFTSDALLVSMRGVSGYDWDDTVYVGASAYNTTPHILDAANITYTLNSNTISVTYNGSQVAIYGIGMPVRVLPNCDYVLEFTVSRQCRSSIFLYDSSGTYIGYKYSLPTTGHHVVTFTTTSEAAYVFICFAPMAVSTELQITNIYMYTGTETETVADYGTYAGSYVTVASGDDTKTFNISQSFDRLYIDCESEHIYSSEGVSYDTYVTVTEDTDWSDPDGGGTTVIADSFPCLKARKSFTITTSNDISVIELIPRYWEI